MTVVTLWRRLSEIQIQGQWRYNKKKQDRENMMKAFIFMYSLESVEGAGS